MKAIYFSCFLVALVPSSFTWAALLPHVTAVIALSRQFIAGPVESTMHSLNLGDIAGMTSTQVIVPNWAQYL